MFECNSGDKIFTGFESQEQYLDMVSAKTIPNLLPRKEEIKIDPGSTSKLRLDDPMNYAILEDHLPRSQISRLTEINMGGLQINQDYTSCQPTFHISMHKENDKTNIQKAQTKIGHLSAMIVLRSSK